MKLRSIILSVSAGMLIIGSAGCDKTTLQGGSYLVDGREGERYQPQDEPEPEPQDPQEPQEPEYLLPVLKISTDGALPVVSKEEYIFGEVVIEDRNGLYVSGGQQIESRMKIRGRGNSTWSSDWPKRPYKIKLDEKQSLLGMDSNKDWALITNYVDRTLLRNHTAMEISRILGFSWTPGCRSVEVYFNGEYQGIYDLFEHKEVAKHKVNINPLEGDYYLEIECSTDKPHYFCTPHGVPIQFKDPEEVDGQQQSEVEGYFEEFENALFGPDFKDPEKGYAGYIDVDSFINNYIVQELSKNYDGTLRKSSFLTLTKGGKLEFYHIWDYDICFGNTYEKGEYSVMRGMDPTGWWIKDYGPDMIKDTGWYNRLFQDPAFVDKVIEKWNKVYSALSDIPSYIDRQAGLLSPAIDRNFEKWPVLHKHVWPGFFDDGTYPEHVAFFKDYYMQRLQWMNSELPSLRK